MKNKRTGLIIESMELASVKSKGDVPSAETEDFTSCTVTTVVVENDREAKILEREKGSYITVEYKKNY